MFNISNVQKNSANLQVNKTRTPFIDLAKNISADGSLTSSVDDNKNRYAAITTDLNNDGTMDKIEITVLNLKRTYKSDDSVNFSGQLIVNHKYPFTMNSKRTDFIITIPSEKENITMPIELKGTPIELDLTFTKPGSNDFFINPVLTMNRSDEKKSQSVLLGKINS